MLRLKSFFSISSNETIREYFSTSSCLLNTSTILWMSCSRRRFLFPSLMKPLLASMMKVPLRLWTPFFIDNHDAGGDAGAIEEVGRQANDAFDIALAYEVAPDVRLGVAAKENAMRKNASALAGTLERTNDVQQVGIVALFIRRCAEVFEPLVPIVSRVETGTPPFVTEGRICDDVVEHLEGVAVSELRIGQRVTLDDERSRIVVKDHVHTSKA